MTEYSALTPEIIERIARLVGEDRVLRPPSIPEEYSRDASELQAAPDLLVKPDSAARISDLLALANELKFPVIPRGGGTGLAGGCLPHLGGVVLSLENMNRIVKIDRVDLTAEVQPGVITKNLRDAVAAEGLFYPPDPAGLDKSTIGGNAATGAGGPSCVKYGTTKDYILGFEAVLPTGRLIRTGTRTRKGVVGFDLTHLLIGSEGTLGVITGLILKLIPHPRAVAGLVAVFPDLGSGLKAVNRIMTGGLLPSAIEFLDQRCLSLIRDLLPFEAPGKTSSLLIVETDGAPEQVLMDIEAMAGLCRDQGAVHVLNLPDETRRARVWEVRRQVSLRIHDYAALYVSEDVAVPLGRIAPLVEAMPAFEKEYGLEIFCFGHAGDGNIHLNVTARDRNNPERVEEGIKAILALVLDMQGTISGEHGIGLAKKEFMPMELSPESLALQRGLKKLFDPNLILNPGKIFPQETSDDLGE